MQARLRGTISQFEHFPQHSFKKVLVPMSSSAYTIVPMQDTATNAQLYNLHCARRRASPAKLYKEHITSSSSPLKFTTSLGTELKPYKHILPKCSNILHHLQSCHLPRFTCHHDLSVYNVNLTQVFEILFLQVLGDPFSRSTFPVQLVVLASIVWNPPTSSA